MGSILMCLGCMSRDISSTRTEQRLETLRLFLYAQYTNSWELNRLSCSFFDKGKVYDTMRPSIVKTMEKELKYAERVVFPHSGHVSMIDDAEMMNDVVNEFVTRVETKQYRY